MHMHMYMGDVTLYIKIPLELFSLTIINIVQSYTSHIFHSSILSLHMTSSLYTNTQ